MKYVKFISTVYYSFLTDKLLPDVTRIINCGSLLIRTKTRAIISIFLGIRKQVAYGGLINFQRKREFVVDVNVYSEIKASTKETTASIPEFISHFSC